MTMQNGSGWNWGQQYRVRAVPGQVQIRRTPNTNTSLVEIMCEITVGPKQGTRVPYTGWLKSAEGVAKTLAELRALGWKGARLGDWKGIGSVECQGKVMMDESPDDHGVMRQYPRLAFPSPIRVLNTDNAVVQADIDALNEAFGVEALSDDIPF